MLINIIYRYFNSAQDLKWKPFYIQTVTTVSLNFELMSSLKPISM